MFPGYDVATNWSGGGGTYPGWGDSTGLAMTSPSGSSGYTSDGGASSVAGTTGSASSLPMGNPITGMIIALVIIFVIMLLVHHWGGGQGEDFSNIKASVWNALIIGLTAAATIPIWKTLATFGASANLPGFGALATYVNAA